MKAAFPGGVVDAFRAKPQRAMTPTPYSLDQKYTLDEGPIALSGVQALVRVPLDQHRIDLRQGLRTATLISGYRGSPLGGLDFLLEQQKPLLAAHDISFMPGVNEELAATAIFGAQLAHAFPNPKYDGVLGIWYGKGPGVDRTGDAFKHGNYAGVGKNGGVLVVAGDDPTAKSSTIPSHSEIALYDAQMPVLFPGTVQEVLDLGLLGFAMSRYSGLWVGLKMVTNVADEFATAFVSPTRLSIVSPAFDVDGKPWVFTQTPHLIAPFSVQTERDIFEHRLEAARRFARANGVNRITVPTSPAWLGIVAAGKTYYDVREGLAKLGFDDRALERYGIRLLKLGMLYPLEHELVREFAQGLEEILVVEEKRDFVELFLRNALYDIPNHPRVIGKRDERGEFFIPGHFELDADLVAGLLAKRLAQRVPSEVLAPGLARIKPTQPQNLPPLSPATTRTGYFCSGCPHNRSTVVPVGSIAAAGIGCHGMVLVMDRSTMHITQMGGEGVQWVGASRFTNLPHLFQNIGDGTLFHSGSLAIRQAVASGANVTYKILYNAAVAMTGGQTVDGGMSVPDLTKLLAAEGVARTLVLTNEVEKYQPSTFAAGVEVWDRDRLDEAQRLLRDIPGVTAVIYDQECAANLRRKRKRGKAVDPIKRVMINEAVCEGCGDCGQKSNCLSVQPVDTEFGRKTQIHQSSCNKDYSCLDGECPAFVTVMATPKLKSKPARNFAPIDDPIPPPEPTRRIGGDANLYLMGIGGTGVVTVNQVLGTAAALEGKRVRSLDQTGLSQKAGAVVSHLKIRSTDTEITNIIGAGEADAYLAFDILAAADAKHLARAHPDRTIAIVSSSHVPTGLMVRNAAVAFPSDNVLRARIDAVTRAAENVYLDAEKVSEELFGSHMQANLIVIGVAYQAGVLPLEAKTIEMALELNGSGAKANIQAFRAGRSLVADPAAQLSLKSRPLAAANPAPPLSANAHALVDSVGATGELHRLLQVRVPELTAFQDARYASAYVAFVHAVREKEAAVTTETRLSEAVARYLFKLMAYKDEYEVARLSLKPEFQRALNDEFGPGAEIRYMLRPPVLRAFGLKKKIGLGRWFETCYRVLHVMRRLRGTPFDMFGYDRIRRLERELITEYRAAIEQELGSLTTGTYERAVTIAKLPDMIRGYDSVKLANVGRYRTALRNTAAADSEPKATPMGAHP